MKRVRTIWTVLLLVAGMALGAAPADLALEWKFDEGQGATAVDSSGNNRNGTVRETLYEPCGGGFAMRLPGGGKHILFKSQPGLNLGNQAGFEFWFKPEALAKKGFHQLMGESARSYLVGQNGSLIVFYAAGGDNQISAPLAIGRWNHVVATFDGKNLNLAVNGEIVKTAASKREELPYAVNAFVIGMSNPKLNQPAGTVDEVRIYRRALTAGEIKAQYEATRAAHAAPAEPAAAAAPATPEAPVEPVAVAAPATPEVPAVSAAPAAATDDAESNAFFAAPATGVRVRQSADRLLIANEHLGLEFRKTGSDIELVRLYGMAAKCDFLAASTPLFAAQLGIDPALAPNNDQRHGYSHGILKNVMPRMAKALGAFTVTGKDAKRAAWQVAEGPDGVTVTFRWENVRLQKEDNKFQVSGTVTLKPGDRFSRWRVATENHSARYGLERIYFPQCAFGAIGGKDDNVIVFPKWRGGMIRNPFAAKAGLGENYHRNGAYYPYYINMQFFALYNDAVKQGIYFGTFDPTPNMTQFIIDNQPERIDWRIAHFPPNLWFRDEDYAQSYDTVVGPFAGDWYDACMIYRDWATRQSWCAKGKTRDRKDIPEWSKYVPLHFYTQLGDSATGTNDVYENQRIAAADAARWLAWSGSDLVFNWYGWSNPADAGATENNWPGNSRRMRNRPGDRWTGFVNRHSPFGNYPAQGALPEMAAIVESLRKSGGYVVPYLCATIYDDGSSENAPYAARLRNGAARDLFGNVLFYENIGWNMCGWDSAWQQRLTEESVAVIRQEHVAGVYLDTIHGMCQPCYWTPHGHSAAGASCGTLGMHRLLEQVYAGVKKDFPDALIEGEDPAENMIDVQDNVLYQRNMRVENKVPLFAAVYGDYIPRSSVGKIQLEDRFFYLECASMFVEGAQIGRLTLRPRPAASVLDFDKPEHREHFAFLKQVIDYYKLESARRYLCLGQVLRPVRFLKPATMPMISYASDETGETDSGATLAEAANSSFDVLQSGVFRAADGSMGIFLVNVGKEGIEYAFDLKPYGAAAARIAPDGGSTPVAGATVSGTLRPREITMYIVK